MVSSYLNCSKSLLTSCQTQECEDDFSIEDLELDNMLDLIDNKEHWIAKLLKDNQDTRFSTSQMTYVAHSYYIDIIAW